MERLSIKIKVSQKILLEFLENPFNLKFWTVHRDLYLIDQLCYECIINKEQACFAEIKTDLTKIKPNTYTIHFSWFINNSIFKSFGFMANKVSKTEVELNMELPQIKEDSKLKTLIKLINIEFDILKQHLETGVISINKSDAIFLQSYHQNLSFT